MSIMSWLQPRPSGVYRVRRVIPERLREDFDGRTIITRGLGTREKAGVQDTRLVFHSTRHSFADALRRAGVPEDTRDALLGHSSGGKIGRSYGTGYTMRQLQEAVARVNYGEPS